MRTAGRRLGAAAIGLVAIGLASSAILASPVGASWTLPAAETALEADPRTGLEAAAAPIDTVPEIPRLTLAEARSRAVVRDPGHVAAAGRVGEAAWARRASVSALTLPTLSVQTSATRFSSPSFNPGTATMTDQLVQGSVIASYELFRGGGRIHELRRAGAELDRARAEEERSRFDAELGTEADFYGVLAGAELLRVARERLRRAERQLEVARARVVTGAAVRTDTLQLVLEVTRAEVETLRQDAGLRVARLQLGRRVGIGGPVDAVPPEAPPPEVLPLSEEEAVAEALERSPRTLSAVAGEHAAEAGVRSARSAYLPAVSLFGQFQGFDDSFPPDATTRAQWGLSVSLPLWDGGLRELRAEQAAVARATARAVRSDEELAVRRDAIDAYQGYGTARASLALADRGVAVAREALQVQEDRYRTGASTIIDLITAQVDLAEAEGDLVAARFDSRLALSRLEALLGRRLLEAE